MNFITDSRIFAFCNLLGKFFLQMIVPEVQSVSDVIGQVMARRRLQLTVYVHETRVKSYRRFVVISQNQHFQLVAAIVTRTLLFRGNGEDCETVRNVSSHLIFSIHLTNRK